MTTSIKITAPVGTTGLAVEPWSKGEIYAVAANWAEASETVWVYGRDGWESHPNGKQVASFSHRPEDALRDIVRDAIAASEGIPTDDVDEDEVDAIVDDAVEIGNEDAE